MSIEKKRTGVILAAGLGVRFNDGSKNNSVLKPLIKVGEIKLLMRTIRGHEIADCDPIVIVIGWQAELVKNEILSQYNGSQKLCFVYNKDFRLQNGVSVLCAKAYVGNEFVLTMADHVLDENIMQLVRRHKPPDNGATLCVDYKLDTIFDMDDATKVYTEGPQIKKIGKKIDTFNCIDTGVFIGTMGLMDAINTVYKENGDVSLSEGVQILADQGKMESLDIKDGYWQDVDTPEMLAYAEKILKNNKKIDVCP